MLAKLLPERHNLYGNSLDLKLNICKKKKWPLTTEQWNDNSHESILTSEGQKAKSLTITTTPWSNYCEYYFSNWLVKKVDLVKISSPHEVLDSCWSLISSWNLNLISLAGTWHYLVALMAPGMTRWLCRLLAPAQSALRLVVHWFPSPREPAKPAIPRFQHWGCPLQLHLGRPASLRKLLNNINNNLMGSRHVWEQIFAVEVGTRTNQAAGALPRPWRRMPRIS